MRLYDTVRLTKGLLACGAVGGFGFIAVSLIAGALRPDYDSLYQPVSALSLGSSGWVQIANFILSGLLILACAVGLRRALSRGRGATSGPLLVGLFGFGLIGAGVFVTDPAFGYPPGAPMGIISWHGGLHRLTSLITFVSLSIACFVFAYRFAAYPRGKTWAAYSFLTGVAFTALFVATPVVLLRGGPGGMVQRLSIALGFAWVGMLAIHTIRGPENRPAAR